MFPLFSSFLIIFSVSPTFDYIDISSRSENIIFEKLLKAVVLKRKPKSKSISFSVIDNKILSQRFKKIRFYETENEIILF